MVTDCQVRRLMMLINKKGSLVKAASMSGMDEKTARKYLRLGRLPSPYSCIPPPDHDIKLTGGGNGGQKISFWAEYALIPA